MEVQEGWGQVVGMVVGVEMDVEVGVVGVVLELGLGNESSFSDGNGNSSRRMGIVQCEYHREM